MADGIEHEIRLFLRAEGVNPTRKVLKEIKSDIEKATSSIEKHSDNWWEVRKIVKDVSSTHARAQKNMQAGLSKTDKAVNKLNDSLKKTTKIAIGLTAAFFGLKAIGGVWDEVLKVSEQYNKSLLIASANAKKYGISVSSLGKQFSSLSDKINLTRQDTVDLFNIYEQNFRNVSTSGFGKITQNLRKIFGPNTEAMKAALGTIAGVVDSNVALQTTFEDRTENDAKSIDAISKLIYLNNQNLSQFKTLQTLVNPGENKEADKTLTMMEQYKKWFHEIKLLAGENIVIPLFKEIATFLNNNRENVKAFFEGIRGWVEGAIQSIKSFVSSVAVSFRSLYKVYAGLSMLAAKLPGGDPGKTAMSHLKMLAALERAEEMGKSPIGVLFQGPEYLDKKEDIPKDSTINSDAYIMSNMLQWQKAINEIRNEQFSVFDALIEKSKTYGSTNRSEVSAAYDDIVAYSREEIKRIQEVIKARQKTQDDLQRSMLATQDVAKREGLQRDMVSNLKEIKNLEKQIEQINVKVTQSTIKRKEIYEGDLNYLNAITSLEKTRVDLADNFAIGIGASAEMRQKVISALNDEIDTIRKQLMELRNSENRNQQAVKEEILRLEDQILQKIKEQSQYAKQLRDGWISAIGAMNTGAGRFTKIMLSGEQNLSASLSRFRTTISSVSGSNVGGFNTSEQFSASAPGDILRRKTGLAYRTGRAEDDMAMLTEQMLRVGVMMQSRASSSNVAGISAVGVDHLRSALAGAGNVKIGDIKAGGHGGIGSGGRTVNASFGKLVVNVRGVDIKNLSDTIGRAVMNALENNDSIYYQAGGSTPGGLESNRTP